MAVLSGIPRLIAQRHYAPSTSDDVAWVVVPALYSDGGGVRALGRF